MKSLLPLGRTVYSAGDSVGASNLMEAELMQYRTPVGLGPSGNMWPR